MDIKVGDVVHVKGTVIKLDGNDDPSVKVAVAVCSDALWVAREYIVHVEPRPLQVGDKVRYGADGPLIVRSMYKDAAWCEDSHGNMCTFKCAVLERVP